MAQGTVHRGPIHLSRRWHALWGGTLVEVLITLSIIGALTVTTLIFAPRYLIAQPGSAQPREFVAASTETHQGLIDDLSALIASCVGVLAVHERGATPYVELVLWLEDGSAGTRGRPDRHEIAVLSHSSVLQTITIYRLTGNDAAGAGPRDLGSDPLWDGPALCDRWRADPRVTPLVLGKGVSDMRVEPVGRPQEEWGQTGAWGGFQRLLLALTWASDSVDGADEASALVDTVMFPPGAWGAPDRTKPGGVQDAARWRRSGG